MHWNRIPNIEQVALQISTDRANTWPNNLTPGQIAGPIIKQLCRNCNRMASTFSDKSYQQYARQMQFPGKCLVNALESHSKLDKPGANKL